MIQTDTDTPMTDIFYSAEYAANRKGWTDAQLEHARRLERDLAKANADKSGLITALKLAVECLDYVGMRDEGVDFNKTDLAITQASLALSQVQAHEDEGVCPYCNKSCATVVDVALHVQAQHAHEA